MPRSPPPITTMGPLGQAARDIDATSLMSRNVSTPGRLAPAMGKQIGSEPVANTSLANGNALPSDSVTVRAAISVAVTPTPQHKVMPRSLHQAAGFSEM